METAQLEIESPAGRNERAELSGRRDCSRQAATAGDSRHGSAGKVRLEYWLPISAIHVLSLLIFVPWYFSWSGVVVAVLGFPLYGLLGITLCYHRL